MGETTGDKLLLVDLDLDRPGYRRFISCWVYRGEEVTFIVDPGPRASADKLVGDLHGRGIDSVDYVLLTHIHLDHGGGCAQVLSAFPKARLYCHPNGVRHLENPSRLWKGSQATIGEIADMYGAPDPVPSGRLASEAELSQRGIRVVPTPGHASHHLSFTACDILFAGEAIATRMATSSGKPYMRPASPPRFFPDVFFESLDRLEALEPEPKRTAFAHYGEAQGVRRWCRMAREQMQIWINLVRKMHDEGEDEIRPMFDVLLEIDPFFGQGRFQELPADIQERERYYAMNSLQGIQKFMAAD
ncbi:MAG TPA: MBL fold metallo-hydrolase [Myxococcota bacterium]|nr:MBL fold metallo-hydrolase [Myxococcota bacterium]